MVILNIFTDISSWFNGFLDLLNTLYSYIFSFGNYVLFAWFLYLFGKLYSGAKEKEQEEKDSFKLQKLKKHGRIGMVVLVAVGFLFLTEIVPELIKLMGTTLSPPFLYDIIGLSDTYNRILTKNTIDTNYIILFIINTLSIFSLVCFILFTYGIYLFVYNKKVLHTRWKPLQLLIIAGIGLFILGFVLPFRLMDEINFIVTSGAGWH